MESILAARYARALADVVGEPRALERTGTELEAFADLYRQSRELRDLLLHPAFPPVRKIRVLSALLKKARTSELTGRFLHLLLKKGRIEILPDVSREFRKLEEQALDRVTVEVTTAVPLPPVQTKRLVASLEKFTGKSVRIDPKVDRAVVGGARTRIGATIYDGTVAGRMQKLRQRLIGER